MRSRRSFQRAFSALRTALIRCGLSTLLLRFGRLGLEETRRHLSFRHLPAGGAGLEIGALHCPLPLPSGSQAYYVDRCVPDVLRTLRADVGAAIVLPHLVTDGFSLECIADKSLDFVIANHVLEHSIDALGTLENWLRVLRPGGMLFVAVPIGARCFDRGRTVTSAAHFLEDHWLCSVGDAKAMRVRNRAHIEEYLAIAAPVLARQRGERWDGLYGERLEHEIERLLGCDSSQVHHHVFAADSFAVLLGLLGDRVCVECVVRSSVEIVGVVRKLF